MDTYHLCVLLFPSVLNVLRGLLLILVLLVRSGLARLIVAVIPRYAHSRQGFENVLAKTEAVFPVSIEVRL